MLLKEAHHVGIRGADGRVRAGVVEGVPEDALGRLRFSRYEGQALSSALIDAAVTQVKAG